MSAQEFLRRRKDRGCAIALAALDAEALTSESHGRLRKVILDQFNDYYNAALDVLASLDSGTVVLNDIYLERLDEIYDVVVGRNGHG